MVKSKAKNYQDFSKENHQAGRLVLLYIKTYKDQQALDTVVKLPPGMPISHIGMPRFEFRLYTQSQVLANVLQEGSRL